MYMYMYDRANRTNKGSNYICMYDYNEDGTYKTTKRSPDECVHGVKLLTTGPK